VHPALNKDSFNDFFIEEHFIVNGTDLSWAVHARESL
jgi:hypothetical protein